MNHTQTKYALKRLDDIHRIAERKIYEKHTKKVKRTTVQSVCNSKAAHKDKEELRKAYDKARDEVVLGDEAKAMELIKAFAKKAN